ncbi:MAG: hypothetical protein DBX60_07725 [Bacillota bacterium]|nr:MAG: hypothetical protein DBX60_07725 [Bacillota bacterium]
MKEQILRQYCSNLYLSSHIPVRIFRGERLLFAFGPSDLKEDEEAFLELPMKALLRSDAPVSFAVTDSVFALACVRDDENGLSVVLGPSHSLPIGPLTMQEAIEKLEKEQHISFDKKLAAPLHTYLASVPVMHDACFLALTVGAVNAVRGEEADESELEDKLNALLARKLNETVGKETLKAKEEAALEGDSPSTNYAPSEQLILYYITNGMHDQLKSYWMRVEMPSATTESSEEIRKVKNAMIASIAIVTSAVLSTELNPEEVLSLRDIYIRQTEECTTISQLFHIRYSITMEFAQRIKELQCRHTGNPTIDRAVAYIQQNLSEKIGLDDLAKLTKTSRAYLSRKFKEEVGMGISQYINRQKIIEAKRFLRFTDKSLAEISGYFDFSSQSYFQKLFKEQTGMTPSEYRARGEA